MKKYRKPSPFNRNLKKVISHVQFRPIIFTIGAAVCIGAVFGFIVLQMVQEGRDEETFSIDATTKETRGDDSQIELPALSLYVLQGGVFSEGENATAYAKSLTEKDIPFVVREAEGQHYVWMNPTHSEKEAKKLAEEMDKQGITAYVKTWELPAKTIKIQGSEAEWLQTYQTLLSSSLDETVMDVEQWSPLLDKELHDDKWQTELQAIMEKEAGSEEQLLLHIIAHYEKMLKD